MYKYFFKHTDEWGSNWESLWSIDFVSEINNEENEILTLGDNNFILRATMD